MTDPKLIRDLADAPGGVRSTDYIEIDRVDTGEDGSFKVLVPSAEQTVAQITTGADPTVLSEPFADVYEITTGGSAGIEKLVLPNFSSPPNGAVNGNLVNFVLKTRTNAADRVHVFAGSADTQILAKDATGQIVGATDDTGVSLPSVTTNCSLVWDSTAWLLSFFDGDAEITWDERPVYVIGAFADFLYVPLYQPQYEANDVAASVIAGRLFSNNTADSLNIQTLPAAADPGAGTGVPAQVFSFIVQNTNGIKVIAATGDKIQIGATATASGGFIQSVVAGSCVRLIVVDAHTWMATSHEGTWTFDS